MSGGTFIVPAANRAAANTAAGEPMFQRGVPEGAPTHYVAGWATIPANKRTAVLAAGAAEFDALEIALASVGLAEVDAADAFAAAATAAAQSALEDVRALAPQLQAAADALRGA